MSSQWNVKDKQCFAHIVKSFAIFFYFTCVFQELQNINTKFI